MSILLFGWVRKSSELQIKELSFLGSDRERDHGGGFVRGEGYWVRLGTMIIFLNISRDFSTFSFSS